MTAKPQDPRARNSAPANKSTRTNGKNSTNRADNADLEPHDHKAQANLCPAPGNPMSVASKQRAQSIENLKFLEPETARIEAEEESERGQGVDAYLTKHEALAEFQKDAADAKAELARRNEKLSKDLDVFNARHAVVLIGSKTKVLNELKDEKTNHTSVIFQSVADFRTLYSNRLIDSGKRKTSLANIWLQSPKRRQYEGVKFSPSGTSKDYYNLFRGFAIEPKPGTNHERFKVFTSEIICNGDDIVFDYVWKWLAHLFQKPWELPETALVLKSAQGTGKGVFVGALGKIIGQHFAQLKSTRQLVGQFDRHLAELILVFANESLWGGDRTGIGALKSMVTDRDSVCEPKGIDIFTVDNYKRLIFASNDNWPIALDLDDRRFLIMEVSEAKKENHDYFGAIKSALTDGGHANLLHELLNVDISSFNVRKLPQTNDAALDIKLRSSSTVTRWWYEVLKEGNIYPAWVDTPIKVEKIELHGNYLSFAETYKCRFPLTPELFSKELKKLCPVFTKRTREKGTRHYVYVFPVLAECRRFFEEKAKMRGRNWD